MHGKAAETANRGAGRTATKEQIRIAIATQDSGDEDRFRIQKMIKEIIETTRCSQSEAELALHDASNNVELAVNNILENSNLDTWTHYKKKGPKGKEEREEPPKKGGNRPVRRGNNPRDFQKGGRTENGEGRENRQPRNKEADGEFRGGRKQQERPRNKEGGRREGRKPNAEHKEEEDNQWKNGPLVFNNDQFADGAEPTSIKTVSQPTAAGPLSFADVVRKNAQKPQPPPPQAIPESPFKLQVNETKQAPQSPHSLGDGLQPDENTGFLAEVSKSPRQHHLDVEPSGVLHEDNSIAFGAQTSPQKLQQSLTAQLKNDLGLGNAFGSSSSKKYHDPLHQNKASSVKAGVVEFLTSNAPAASSGDWQFGFEAAAPPPQHSVSDEHQFRREPPSKMNEPIRNEIGLGSSNLNDSNSSRNASTVLNQYVQQQQSSQPSYSHQPFNRNRNGANLPFSNNTYSDNFNPSDLRSNNFGAPSSPPKTQQPLGSQQLQSQQSHHHQQTHVFPPAQLPYPYFNIQNMYSPVAGLRDEFTPMLPFQNSLYQFNMDALSMMPQLANATSAGPLPNNHQGQHHQNSHQQQSSVQQPLQHNQSSHSQNQNQRNEHYNDNLFVSKPLNLPPASQQQNNGSNGHNQQNSNLGNQQRQPLAEGSVAPPPGFGNLATGPFLSQRSIFPNAAFQAMPFNQFPYVMPKSK